MNYIAIKFCVIAGFALSLAGCGSTAVENPPSATRYTITISEVVVTPTDDACPDPQWLGHGGPSGLDWVWSCAIVPGIEQCNKHYTDCLDSNGLDKKKQCSQVGPSGDNVFDCECVNSNSETTTCTFRASN